jgi:PAS domain S-box-containing protein
MNKQDISENRLPLEAIFETMQAGIVLVNPQGIITFANQRMAAMFGCTIDELVGSGYAEHVHPDQRGVADARLRQIIAGEIDHMHNERLFIRRDGRDFWGYISGRRLEDAGGNLISLVGVITNISEVKRVEEALRISEQKFSKTFSHAPLLMTISDIETGRYLEVNKRFCETSGFTQSEAVGRTSTELGWISEFERKRLIEILERDGSVQDLELTLTAKNGSTVICLYSAELINVDGDDRLLSIAMDITERKRTEELLREGEERYRQLVEQSSAWIWKTDNNLKHTYSNDNVETILGYSAEELCAMDIRNMVHPDDYAALARTVEESVAGRRGWNGLVLRWLTRDGLWRFVESSGGPIFDEKGVFTGLQGVDVDITDRLQLQQEREKGQRLESLGLLAGGIAHDFNNILTGIVGNLSLARMMIDSDHQAAKRLAECEKASKRASELTQQLLTFARGGEPVKKVVDISRLINEAASFALRGSNVKSVLELSEGLWSIDADEGQIVQVLNNLLINAAQAMPDGGTVTVRSENCYSENAEQPPGCYVRLTVRDTGVGIPAGLLPRIFDPYFTTKKTGSGLGLASVYSIVTRHGGTVKVSSRPGTGTEFVVCLPAICESPAVEADDRTGVDDGMVAGRRILVMDDEEMIRDVVSMMLSELGCEAILCSEGRCAVDMYRIALEQGTPYDAVILDLTVPGGMGGVEAARLIREMDADARLLVSSGYSNDAVISDLGRYGFSGAVMKPYTLENLLDELGRILIKG